MIKDSFGRPVLNLRISVTQRCNKIAISLGITRIKLTGGEPLLRGDILDIIKGLAELRNLEDLSMTTNGTFLAPMAKDLRSSGLERVNVSLPSLNPEVYAGLMGGSLKEVLEGIDAAVEAGLHPVKVNMLILAGVNEEEIPAMIHFAGERGTVLQLIELEPVNIGKHYYERHHYPLNAVESDLARQAVETKVRRDMQNRRIFVLPEGTVEVIHPIENTEFCAHCTRLRITSDGKLKPCLMVNTNLVDVLTRLRSGANEEQLTKLLAETCKAREPYYKPPPLQRTKTLAL